MSGRTPFDGAEGWRELRDLPLEDKVARFTDTETRVALTESAEEYFKHLPLDWTNFFPLPDSPVRHDLGPEESLGAIAKQKGLSIVEAWIEIALEMDGRRVFTLPFLNQNMDEAVGMIQRPYVVMGLADAGAHARQIMDASQPTFFLTHWVREKGMFTIEEAIRRLTSDTADLFGIKNRGRLTPGSKADVNVIDLSLIHI